MNIERNISYTEQLYQHADDIRDRLARLSHVPDVKSLEEVMHDFLEFIWKYDAVDKSIHRFWATFDIVIQNYFNQFIHLKGRSPKDYVLTNEYESYLYDYHKKYKKLTRTLNHKGFFQPYFRERGYPVTRRIGSLVLTEEGKPLCHHEDGTEEGLDEAVERNRGIFAKPSLDAQGHGAMKLLPGDKPGHYTVNGKPGGNQAFIEGLPVPPPVYFRTTHSFASCLAGLSSVVGQHHPHHNHTGW